METGKILLFFILMTAGLSSAADGVTAISLSPALTEIVFKLGRGGMLAGRSDVCNFPAEARKLPVAGGFAAPFAEKIIRMRPDYLLVNDLVNPGIIKTFRSCGIKTLFLPCKNMDDYRRCVRSIGEALDCRAAAEAETARCAGEVAALKSLPRLKAKVLWVIWDAPLMVAGGGSFPASLIELAGAENAAGAVEQEYFKCSFDWLLRTQPDVIIWSAAAKPDRKHRLWGSLEAVRHGRVIHGIDPDLIQRPGPRMFDGVRLLRKAMESWEKDL